MADAVMRSQPSSGDKTHAKASAGPTGPVTGESTPFDSEVSAARSSGGSPLAPGLRAFMEPRFGTTFDGVKIHSDTKAAALAQKVHARAFTFGQDVFFANGEFQSQGSGARRLLAHELTHTLQQKRAAPQIQRAPPTPQQQDCTPDQSVFVAIELPGQFFDIFTGPIGAVNITEKDVNTLTREQIRTLGRALAYYVNHRKCTNRAPGTYYQHEALLDNIVAPKIEEFDNREGAPDRLDDWIFHVVDNLELGDADRTILMQCAPYIHRRMKGIVAGTPLAPATAPELVEVGYFPRATTEDICDMTIAETLAAQNGQGHLGDYFRGAYTNAGDQLIHGIKRQNTALTTWQHPGLEHGGTSKDLRGILGTIRTEMRLGVHGTNAARSMLGTSAVNNKSGATVKPAMQLSQYITQQQKQPGTLYAADLERGATGIKDYAQDLELRTLRTIWPD